MWHMTKNIYIILCLINLLFFVLLCFGTCSNSEYINIFGSDYVSTCSNSKYACLYVYAATAFTEKI